MIYQSHNHKWIKCTFVKKAYRSIVLISATFTNQRKPSWHLPILLLWLIRQEGGGEMLWAGCQDIAVGNPPVRRERSSACPSLTSTAQCTSLYTSSLYISKHLGSDFVKTISGNQMCCALAKYWISRWRQGLQADRIPLATLCGLVRCVALTHAPGHRPLNKRDQCCFFSMASNFFLVLYLNATNAKCAMF